MDIFGQKSVASTDPIATQNSALLGCNFAFMYCGVLIQGLVFKLICPPVDCETLTKIWPANSHMNAMHKLQALTVLHDANSVTK